MRRSAGRPVSVGQWGPMRQVALKKRRHLPTQFTDNWRPKSMSVKALRGSFRHMMIGYARVSTTDQNPDHQIDALLRAGVTRENVHVDYASGSKASRPQLDLVLRMLRETDVLKVIWTDWVAPCTIWSISAPSSNSVA